MDNESAFSLLFQRAEEELVKIRDQGISSFSHDQYADVMENARKAEKVKEIIKLLKNAQENWRRLKLDDTIPAHRIAEQQDRIPHGLVTPQEAFRIPLLKTLVDMGGRGRTGIVLDKVGKIMDPLLTEQDRRYLVGRNEVRWRNAICWERNECVREGLLIKGSPRGIWEISERGRQYLRNRNKITQR